MVVLNPSLSTIHPISGRKQPTATGLTRPALAPIRSPATVRSRCKLVASRCVSSSRCGIPPRPPPSPPHAGPPRARRDVGRTRGSCRSTRRTRGAVRAPSRFQHPLPHRLWWCLLCHPAGLAPRLRPTLVAGRTSARNGTGDHASRRRSCDRRRDIAAIHVRKETAHAARAIQYPSSYPGGWVFCRTSSARGFLRECRRT